MSFGALDNRGLECRRELHQTKDRQKWHFVIAHAGINEPPSQEDLVTDVNPWQFMDKPLTGFLHDERFKVQMALSQAGAEPWYVGLRGIATRTQAHRPDLMPDAPDYT